MTPAVNSPAILNMFGSINSKPWRLEWGPPQRKYIDGHELRIRMELPAARRNVPAAPLPAGPAAPVNPFPDGLPDGVSESG